jgi:hypothetical protein
MCGTWLHSIQTVQSVLRTVCTLDCTTTCVNYVYVYRRILIRPRWDSQTLMLRRRTKFCCNVVPNFELFKFVSGAPTVLSVCTLPTDYFSCTVSTVQNIQSVWVMLLLPNASLLTSEYTVCTRSVPHWLSTKTTMLFWIQTSLCRHTLMNAV